MKKSVVLRGLTLGEGRPKVCVSIMGQSVDEVYREAKKVCNLPCDIIEWRVDWLEEGTKVEKVMEVLPRLRELIGDVPLIFTIRTAKEGGERSYTLEEYMEINIAAILSGYVDMIDVELFAGDEVVKEIIEQAHGNGSYVIASNHDFHKTPKKEELIGRFMQMEGLKADVLKIAVMPRSVRDVLTLLEATLEATEEKVEQPVVSMAMSDMGVITRVAGEAFGSVMTFGAGDQVSAPGQIPAKDLVQVLDMLHKEP